MAILMRMVTGICLNIPMPVAGDVTQSVIVLAGTPVTVVTQMRVATLTRVVTPMRDTAEVAIHAGAIPMTTERKPKRSRCFVK